MRYNLSNAERGYIFEDSMGNSVFLDWEVDITNPEVPEHQELVDLGYDGPWDFRADYVKGNPLVRDFIALKERQYRAMQAA